MANPILILNISKKKKEKEKKPDKTHRLSQKQLLNFLLKTEKSLNCLEFSEKVLCCMN